MADNESLEKSMQCNPISTLQELVDWKPSASCYQQQVSRSSIPLKEHSFSGEGGETLLCHDMKGGYREDRFCSGSEDADAYRFFNWASIDLFIYFSHHLVTIPPITWVNAAHNNGVRVLGTFITEWADGEKACETILADEDSLDLFVNQLVQVAKAYCFEGWLINIENKIAQQQTDRLIAFVERLKRQMDAQIPGSRVLWYDSVVVPEGELLWQNELNSRNEPMFKACDGIFLNYVWNSDNLRNSWERAKSMERTRDVFVGIDVFGRGCYGGGGWETCLAVDEVRKAGLSMAIFAPGWVHEVLGSDDFTDNEYRFWSKLNLRTRHVPSRLPIETSFCQGFGDRLYEKGSLRSDKPWFNLLRQQLQPSNLSLGRIYTKDAYSGGGCLLVSDLREPLIRCHLSLPEAGMVVALTFKCSHPETSIWCTIDGPGQGSGPSSIQVKALDDSDACLSDDFKSLLDQNDVSMNPNNGWVTRAFLVSHNGPVNVTAIYMKVNNAKTNSEDMEILLGQIKVLEAPRIPLTD